MDFVIFWRNLNVRARKKRGGGGVLLYEHHQHNVSLKVFKAGEEHDGSCASDRLIKLHSKIRFE